MRWGAYLHDTGKVAVPDSILLKPGRLTAEEFEAVKLHALIGYEMLSKIPNMPTATLEVVLHHHEKQDGSGYPHRLAGTDIPLAARIFAVIDVYDDLTSERPYKRAWTREEALAGITRTGRDAPRSRCRACLPAVDAGRPGHLRAVGMLVR